MTNAHKIAGRVRRSQREVQVKDLAKGYKEVKICSLKGCRQSYGTDYIHDDGLCPVHSPKFRLKYKTGRIERLKEIYDKY